MKNKPKVICIIPARGGSKGIKSKNIQLVCKKPLIYYPIGAAIRSGICDDIFVSTDSKKIADKAKKYGAQVPFLRKKKYAKDFTTTEETLKNALIEFENYKKTKYDICVFLTANRIFRKYKWINEVVKNLIDDAQIESSFAVKGLYSHFWHKKANKYEKVLPWMNKYTSRQIAPEFYREDTSLVCASRSHLWRKGKRIGKKVKFLVHDYMFSEIDIHSKEDLYLSEYAMKYVLKKYRSPF